LAEEEEIKREREGEEEEEEEKEEEKEEKEEEEEEEEEEEVDITQNLAEQFVNFHNCDPAAHIEAAHEHEVEITKYTFLQKLNELFDAVPDTLSSREILTRGTYIYKESEI